jgi:hypothetical protein
MFSISALLLQQSLNITFKMLLASTAIEIIWDSLAKMFLSPSTKIPLKFFKLKVPLKLIDFWGNINFD